MALAPIGGGSRAASRDSGQAGRRLAGDVRTADRREERGSVSTAQRTLPGLIACALLSSCQLDDAGEEDWIGSNQPLSFEEYEASIPREAESGVYIVDFDIPVYDRKQLRELWSRFYGSGRNLAVAKAGNTRLVWNTQQKVQLTYCVSKQFDTQAAGRYNQVVQAMLGATQAWEAAANVKFQHVAAQDTNCTANNNNVLFDVSPTNENQYIARAFFPDAGRAVRNVLVTSQGFNLGAGVKYNLTGVLTHELGHALGFRHEHTRPEAGTCFEDNQFEGLTPYDKNSVMHYPQCNGNQNTALTLTQQDITGVQALYGPPGPGTNPTTPPPGSVPRTKSYDLTVTQGQRVDFGPIPVVAGTVFAARISGTGDPDLYVRFGGTPTETQYDCRPNLESANEECNLDVPANATVAHVSVMGETTASFTLKTDWTAPNNNEVPAPSTSNGLGQPSAAGAQTTSMVTGGCNTAASIGTLRSLLLVLLGAAGVGAAAGRRRRD
jgi:hypothetical protein